jgi:DNA-binding transcriptional ArsR family regulator
MKIKTFQMGLGTQIFKAFADESRIRILHLIFLNEEMCISDLEQVLEFTQTKTSRHLAYLKNAGLTSARRADGYVFYYLKESVVQLVQQLFRFMARDAQLLQDQQAYQVLYSNRELAASRIQLRKMAEPRKI